MESNKYSLLETVYILFRWRKLIFWNLIALLILSIMISLILPRWFTSSATILIPSKETADFGISSILKKLPTSGLSLGIEALSEDASIYLAILKSRKLKEEVINNFDLIKRFKVKNIEEALKEFDDYYSTDLNEDGTITLKVHAKTPFFPSKKEDDKARVLSKEMADFLIKQLDEINKKLKNEKAKNFRIFIEKRYFTALSELSQKEEEFKAFQQKYGTISLSEQTNATIKAAAELKAKILIKEIELGVMNYSFENLTSENLKITQEIKELRSKYDALVRSSNEMMDQTSNNQDIFLPLSNLPSIGLLYARLLRDIMIQEKIIEFLLPQYEQAKIQEAKDTPTLQLLDEPKIPIKKSKPKRVIFILVVCMIGFIITVIYIFFVEKIEFCKREKTHQYLIFQEIIKGLRSDVHFFKRRNRF